MTVTELLRGERTAAAQLPVAEVGSNAPLAEGLCLLFGAWLCFQVKERLPACYNQNNICFYSDVVFHINLAGVRFSNGS